MTKKISNIVVVGGGTAGWLSATILAAKLDIKTNQHIKITLVESPTIPTIGVGEGTVPTMRETLKLIGISETDFIQHCDVTFKQAINFINWRANPIDSAAHYYFHPFTYPKSAGADLSTDWCNSQMSYSFVDTVSVQGLLCQQNKAPKKITTPEYKGTVDYAYHLNATKFAALLHRHGVDKLGINYLQADVVNATVASDGAINALVFEDKSTLEADFFIDCSGFSAVLLNQALNVGFIDKSDVLFVDKAIAVQVPYASSNQTIPSYTLATAQKYGWIWDIGLTERRGVGHVYSSKYTSDEAALSCLKDYLGGDVSELNFRTIDMKVGYREKFWHKNCVAFGLSAGFVEPLEATALLLIEASAKLLADLFPYTEQQLLASEKQFNETVRYSWDRVIDFIKLHYYLSDRDDTEFWTDNQKFEALPLSLQDKLNRWQYRAPSIHDFPSRYEVFGLDNYQYILFGMDFKSQLQTISVNNDSQHTLNRLQEYNLLEFEKLNAALPSHRVLIDKIKLYGLSKL
ncbi:tryptophan 7-halogenase [Pseudoalteromonas tunicata]|uniref:tryptophan halogenase family protein n=1 Tax=Pseudoalteromonas tunicata TaxID=314281 RepID=UPI00273FAE15|nr:tryptophan halogenase family protein [Pseudoalteromonas tunicata]MDP5211453.1 tryptophan 7-halogenase [Pseudoalteromonas tunicata]